jgi:hypothetical protein
MQKLLHDTGIIKKIVAMMLMLGAVAIITAAVNAWKIRSIDARYAELVDHKLPAITHVVRSNRQVAEMLKDGFRAVVFVPASPAGRKAASELETHFRAANASMDRAVQLDRPSRPSSKR